MFFFYGTSALSFSESVLNLFPWGYLEFSWTSPCTTWPSFQISSILNRNSYWETYWRLFPSFFLQVNVFYHLVLLFWDTYQTPDFFMLLFFYCRLFIVVVIVLNFKSRSATLPHKPTSLYFFWHRTTETAAAHAKPSTDFSSKKIVWDNETKKHKTTTTKKNPQLS